MIGLLPGSPDINVCTAMPRLRISLLPKLPFWDEGKGGIPPSAKYLTRSVAAPPPPAEGRGSAAPYREARRRREILKNHYFFSVLPLLRDKVEIENLFFKAKIKCFLF